MRIWYIDSQNIKLGVRELWSEIDRENLFIYTKVRYKLDELKFFVWYLSTNIDLYTHLRAVGYTVVFKKTHEYDGKVKGNVDTLMMKVWIKDADEGKVSKAYLFSWDWDFEVLIDYWKEKWVFEKVFIPNHKKISQLILDCTVLEQRVLMYSMLHKII